MAAISYALGYHAIFWAAALLAIPAAICLARFDAKSVDYAKARGARREDQQVHSEAIRELFQDRVLLYFLASVFLFHLANAAMLPELGEMLAHGNPRTAAPFMSACVIVTQLTIAASAAWIGRRAQSHGRKRLLLLGFGVLPIRGVLYTLTAIPAALIAIQILDGVANAIYTIVAPLVIIDRTEGTGRFNLVAGALATMLGTSAALSNAAGGWLVQHAGFHASFLGLAVIAALAFIVCGNWFPKPVRLRTKDFPPPFRPSLPSLRPVDDTHLNSIASPFAPLLSGFRGSRMKTKTERTLSRREFAQRAAVLSATAPFVPVKMIRSDIASDFPPQTSQSSAKLSAPAQAEADSRYQQILSLYSDRLDDAQKANLKRMCIELQSSLERIRTFKLENSDVPALFLKPVYERDRKPQTPSSKPASGSTKP